MLFDRRFNQRFARKVAELGYEIETKWATDARGNIKYAGWDIKGIPQPVLTRFSRRSREVEEAEKEIIAERKARDPDAPDRLSTVARDKLGATTRQHKRRDLTLEDFRAYWDGRITPEEGRTIAETIERARQGKNPPPEPSAAKAVAFSIHHHFEREAVVPFDQLAITAMEHGMGGMLPEEILPEAKRQDVLLAEKEGRSVATTQAVLAEERRMLAFARAGLGTCAPLGEKNRDRSFSRDWLNADQQAAVRHVLNSSDRVIAIRGAAGVGKTSLMQEAVEAIEHGGHQVFTFAPSAEASRGVLREAGFAQAETVARLLQDEALQKRIKGQVLWIDEASLLGTKTLAAVFDLAKAQDAARHPLRRQ